jgi:hypothetical protein
MPPSQLEVFGLNPNTPVANAFVIGGIAAVPVGFAVSAIGVEVDSGRDASGKAEMPITNLGFTMMAAGPPIAGAAMLTKPGLSNKIGALVLLGIPIAVVALFAQRN